MKLLTLSIACASVLASSFAVAGEDIDIGLLYRGAFRIDQANVPTMKRDEVRLAGMRMFTNPFIKADGFGDGDDNPPSPTPGTDHQGERGTLQGNGTWQRINGLDAQTCLECHSIISRRKVPMTFGIGGVGGNNNNVLGAGGGTFVDLTTTDKKHNINGRIINPPFIFGAGGVELVANEMTKELNDQLKATPAGGTTALSAKGISFGSVTRNPDGSVKTDVSGKAVGVEGVFDPRPLVNGAPNTDFLVVAPFGRKGDNISTRAFDINALSFHFGMDTSPGDPDGDGVFNEVTDGELSVLSIFVASAQTPFQTKVNKEAKRGLQVMKDVGCTACHVPSMETNTKTLSFRFPDLGNEPFNPATTYYSIDLTKSPMSFEKNKKGGITVPLFADLKRHYMGPSLAEFNDDAMFTTMRLWGVADTAPYLHDGRALTIREAIEMHGADASSEANPAVSAFLARSAADQDAVLAFLDTLRSADGTFPELLNDLAKKVALEQGVAH